ncbi:phospholipid scramblase 2-like [Ornithodoros turicata]|uniref:phospholipid scramblase 2-like n=1 Tax=Ornithodoros turicata TaxID=34597 RepID=UPI0031395E3F
MAAHLKASRTQSQDRRIIQPRTGLEGLAEETMVRMTRGPDTDVVQVAPLPPDFERVSYKRYIYNVWQFTVQGTNGDILFIVNKEYQRCFALQRFFSLASGSFFAYMVNMSGVVVMSFERLLRLQGGVKGCFCCCLGQEMRIEAPLGRQIAYITEDWTLCGTSLTIYDAMGTRVFKVIGPTFPPYFKGTDSPVVFQVKTKAGNTMGEIRVAKSISVSFPVDLDVYIKGCLIGCAILVALMFDMRGCALNCWQSTRSVRRYP